MGGSVLRGRTKIKENWERKGSEIEKQDKEKRELEIGNWKCDRKEMTTIVRVDVWFRNLNTGM